MGKKIRKAVEFGRFLARFGQGVVIAWRSERARYKEACALIDAGVDFEFGEVSSGVGKYIAAGVIGGAIIAVGVYFVFSAGGGQ